LPGKERQRHVGGLRPARERRHLALHVGPGEIDIEIDRMLSDASRGKFDVVTAWLLTA
jgi:hypothetical protein